MTTATATKPKTITAQKPAGPIILSLYGEEIRAIKAVALAASKDPARPVLNGVHLKCLDGELVIEATDGYRLHRAVAGSLEADFEALIPAAWLVTTISQVKPGKGPTKLELTETRASISNDMETRSVALIAGEYPDCASLIEKYEALKHDPKTEIAVNPRYFADVLKACELFAGDGTWGAARFRVASEALRPLRFDVSNAERKFLGLLMPVRVTAT